MPSHAVEAILADVERLEHYGDPTVPTVLAGDWNSVGEDPTYDPPLDGETRLRRMVGDPAPSDHPRP